MSQKHLLSYVITVILFSFLGTNKRYNFKKNRYEKDSGRALLFWKIFLKNIDINNYFNNCRFFLIEELKLDKA